MKRSIILLLVLVFGIPAVHAKDVEIQAGVFGGTLYQLSYAFSELAKSHAPDMSVTTVETPGSAAGIIKMSAKPDTRIAAATYVTILEAVKGRPPFKKPFSDIRVIGNFTKNIQTLITLDEKIRTLDDLKGKRIGLGPKPTVIGKNHWSIIQKGCQDPGSIKPFYMKWGTLKDALMDGSIDAMVLGVSTRLQGPWATVPVFKEIVASRGNPHFISIPEHTIRAAATADDIDYPPMMIPKDAIGPDLPSADTMAWSEKLALFATSRFSEDAAYTIAKVLYEHGPEMVKQTPVARGVWPELVADINLPEEMIHPGALKYYKEKGLR